MPPLAFDFTNRSVLVTGVGRAGQIGCHVARAFGLAGAQLTLCDVNAVQVAERAREFQAEGIAAQPSAGDLTQPDLARLAVETAVKHYGGLDAVVNVAGGLTSFGPLAEAAPSTIDRELAINLKTAAVMSQAAQDELGRRRGTIVNFASIAVLEPQAQLAVYSAAKGAVAAFTRSLAVELRPRGVRVNAVAPGMARTQDNVAAVGGGASYVELDDLTHAVMFLASDAALGISGVLLPVAPRIA